MKDNVEDSCGGTGCGTPEHDRRLGHDGVNDGAIDGALVGTTVAKFWHNDESMTIQPLTPISLGALVEYAEKYYGEDWEDVQISYVNPFINYTTSVAN